MTIGFALPYFPPDAPTANKETISVQQPSARLDLSLLKHTAVTPAGVERRKLAQVSRQRV
jgi:hypothetical protein